MASRIKCPFCGGMFRQNADGTIHGHGTNGQRYPNCAGPITPATAQCSTCKRYFEDGESFDAHRSNGTCVHPFSIGYEAGEDGVWRKIRGLIR